MPRSLDQGIQKNGRDWTRTNDLTDVNPKNQGRVRDVILLMVESINN
jgi:hypothetical protein